jgi:hypothetical protein
LAERTRIRGFAAVVVVEVVEGVIAGISFWAVLLCTLLLSYDVGRKSIAWMGII